MGISANYGQPRQVKEQSQETNLQFLLKETNHHLHLVLLPKNNGQINLAIKIKIECVILQ